jgi:hypothetical protein
MRDSGDAARVRSRADARFVGREGVIDDPSSYTRARADARAGGGRRDQATPRRRRSERVHERGTCGAAAHARSSRQDDTSSRARRLRSDAVFAA